MEISNSNTKTVMILMAGLVTIIGIIGIMWYSSRDKPSGSNTSSLDQTPQNPNQPNLNSPPNQPNLNSPPNQPNLNSPPNLSDPNQTQNLNLSDPIIPYNIEEQENQALTVECDEEKNYFKEFLEAYKQVIYNNCNYVYGARCVPAEDINPGLAKNETKIKCEGIKEKLSPILQIINYKLIVHHGLKKTSLTDILTNSQNDNIKQLTIKALEEAEDKVSIFKSILSDSEICKKLIIHENDIETLKKMDISGFKLNYLPSVFGVFKNLSSVNINNTGIKYLEPLNEAKSLKEINADNNKITAICGLEDLRLLERCYFFNNNIYVIDPAFLENHGELNKKGNNHGIFISLSADSNKFEEFTVESRTWNGRKLVVLKKQPSD